MAIATLLRGAALALALLATNSPAGAFELEFIAASLPLYAKPHDLVLSPGGRYLYVADNDNDRMAVLDPLDLELLGTFGEGDVTTPATVEVD